MIRPSGRTWIALSFVGLTLLFSRADAQQPPNSDSKPIPDGDRGFQQGAARVDQLPIDQPFADRMAHHAAAKPGIEREHQAKRYDAQLRGEIAKKTLPRLRKQEGLNWRAKHSNLAVSLSI